MTSTFIFTPPNNSECKHFPNTKKKKKIWWNCSLKPQCQKCFLFSFYTIPSCHSMPCCSFNFRFLPFFVIFFFSFLCHAKPVRKKKSFFFASVYLFICQLVRLFFYWDFVYAMMSIMCALFNRWNAKMVELTYV